MKINTLYKIFLGLLTAFLFHQCASVGSLGGGPKDEDAPVFLGSEPQKYSRNTKPKKILMQFDEFLVLKSLSENLIISPALNEDPDIKLRGKNVLIKNQKDIIFEENTTYTYYFDDAIVDLHEENPIKNFEFVFSTGASLDSLSVRGKVLQTSNLIPEENVYVSLYKQGMNDTIAFDSLPYFVRPYYVSKTNELGEYQINNVRYGEYLLFALKDLNGNYYFDMPGENISFLDSLVTPQEVFDFIPDSIPIRLADTALMDSLWEYHSHSMVENPVNLFLFAQDDSIPRLMETFVELEKRIDFFFKYPIRDSLKIKIIDNSIEEDWYLPEYSSHQDTLSLWLKKFPTDTLIISLQVDTLKLDTLEFVVNAPKKEEDKNKRKRRNKEDTKSNKNEEENGFKYVSNLENPHPFYKDLTIKFEAPLAYANFENMVVMEDTIEIQVDVKFTDSIQRNLRVHYEWEEGIDYKIILPQESLRDIFKQENDSLVFKFTTTTEDDYGDIQMNISIDSLEQSGDPFILLLVQGDAEKESIIQKHIISSDTNLTFNHIREGDYYLKAIKDFNNNGRWNTGHYGSQLKAEPVYFFQKTLSMQDGWTVSDSWIIHIEDRKRPPVIKKEEEK